MADRPGGRATSDPAVPGPDLRLDLLTDMGDLRRAADLWRDVWGGAAWPVQAALLRANVHAGNYVAGAWLDGRLVGASMGFLAHPAAPVLHSHITGVVAEAAGHGIGRALKEHQADWCRANGIDAVTWTFDPLVARNAWFNLARLGVDATEYLVDFYGDMPDERNRGQGSDRLHVAWDVSGPPSRSNPATSPDDSSTRDDPAAADDPTATGDPGRDDVVDLVADEHHRPRVRADDGAAVLAVAVPADVEDLRRRDPQLAIDWRRAVRAALADRVGTADRPGPWRISAFTRDRRYLLTPRPGD